MKFFIGCFTVLWEVFFISRIFAAAILIGGGVGLLLELGLYESLYPGIGLWHVIPALFLTLLCAHVFFWSTFVGLVFWSSEPEKYGI